MNSYSVFIFCLHVMFLQRVCLFAINDAVQMHCANASCKYAVQGISQTWWTDQSQIHQSALVQACDCVIGWSLCVDAVMPVLCSAWHGLAMTLHCRTFQSCTPPPDNFTWQCHLMNPHGVSVFCLYVMFLWGAHLPATDDGV